MSISELPVESPAVAESGRGDLPPLIPVRMLNEFAYCPRLAYLEWIQGEWADNLDTEQGTFAHRHVDRGDRKTFTRPAAHTNASTSSHSDAATTRDSQAVPDIAEPPAEVLHARSVSLSCETLGITAKLDLVELDGHLATPVDYKRGSPPDNAERAYEPERVQIAAQALILRAQGYQCDAGVLYFAASRQRVVVPVTDELVQRTKELIAGLRAAAASQICPPPLDDSPKCVRCSLVGICLPDEVNLIRLTQITHTAAPAQSVSVGQDVPDDSPPHAPTQAVTVRKLLPTDSPALPVYLNQQGAFVGKSGDQLTVKRKGEQIAALRLLDVSQLCVFGNVMLSGAVIAELASRGVPICHFSYGGWFHSITTGLTHKNAELRIRQAAIAANPALALQLARPLITGKIQNQRTLIRRHLDGTGKAELNRMAELRTKAAAAESAATLMGLEGMAARDYFSQFFTLFGPAWQANLEHRNRRPPTDPVNAVLSFLYALLTKELTIVAQAVGFDPMIGFLHTPRYGRPSLALDLAEQFRPLIADSTTLTVFNNQEVNPDSFLRRAAGVALTDAARKTVIAAYERRMSAEVTHPLFGYALSYRRLLELQTRLLARTVLGEIETYPPFCTR